MEKSGVVTADLVEWVARSSKLAPRYSGKWSSQEQSGMVNGLAVNGVGNGFILPIEVEVMPTVVDGGGRFELTGIIDEEQFGDRQRTMKRHSMARSSLQNVLTALRKAGYQIQEYDIHINIPGGLAADGPSAGITMAVAVASALSQLPVAHDVAMSGEVSCRGFILPVGGIAEKLEAAQVAGMKRVYIAKENERAVPEEFKQSEMEIIAVDSLSQLFSHLWGLQSVQNKHIS
jgi:Lon-like ATP-dependent protease